MAGVVKNLNVNVTLTLEKPATKVVRRRIQFSIDNYRTTMEQLLRDFSTPPWELYFDHYCSS